MRTESERDERKAGDERRRSGWQCVDCGKRTAARNDVGEPQCHPCQRVLREATEHATAVCACGEPMLSPAPMCGFCEAELRAMAATG